MSRLDECRCGFSLDLVLKVGLALLADLEVFHFG